MPKKMSKKGALSSFAPQGGGAPAAAIAGAKKFELGDPDKTDEILRIIERVPHEQRNPEELRMLTSLLQTVSIFSQIKQDGLEMLCSDVDCIVFEPGDTLFKEGDIGDNLHVVLEGEVEIWVGGSPAPLASEVLKARKACADLEAQRKRRLHERYGDASVGGDLELSEETKELGSGAAAFQLGVRGQGAGTEAVDTARQTAPAAMEANSAGPASPRSDRGAQPGSQPGSPAASAAAAAAAGVQLGSPRRIGPQSSSAQSPSGHSPRTGSSPRAGAMPELALGAAGPSRATVAVEKDVMAKEMGTHIISLNQGAMFGEIALLQGSDSKRTATVRAGGTSRTVTLVVTKDVFSRTAMKVIEKENAAKRECLALFSVFRDMSQAQRQKLTYYMQEFTLSYRESLATQGAAVSSLYLLAEGRAKCVDGKPAGSLTQQREPSPATGQRRAISSGGERAATAAAGDRPGSSKKCGGKGGGLLTKRDMGFMQGRQYQHSAVSGGAGRRSDSQTASRPGPAVAGITPRRPSGEPTALGGGGKARWQELRHTLRRTKPELAVLGAGNMVGDTEFSLGEEKWGHSYISETGVLRGYSISCSDLQRRLEPYLLQRLLEEAQLKHEWRTQRQAGIEGHVSERLNKNQRAARRMSAQAIRAEEAKRLRRKQDRRDKKIASMLATSSSSSGVGVGDTAVAADAGQAAFAVAMESAALEAANSAQPGDCGAVPSPFAINLLDPQANAKVPQPPPSHAAAAAAGGGHEGAAHGGQGGGAGAVGEASRSHGSMAEESKDSLGSTGRVQAGGVAEKLRPNKLSSLWAKAMILVTGTDIAVCDDPEEQAAKRAEKRARDAHLHRFANVVEECDEVVETKRREEAAMAEEAQMDRLAAAAERRHRISQCITQQERERGIFPTTGWARPQWRGGSSTTSSRVAYKEGQHVESCPFILPPPTRPSAQALTAVAHEFQTSQSELLGVADAEATPAAVLLRRRQQEHAGVAHGAMAGGFMPTSPRRQQLLTAEAAEARLRATTSSGGGGSRPTTRESQRSSGSSRSARSAPRHRLVCTPLGGAGGGLAPPRVRGDALGTTGSLSLRNLGSHRHFSSSARSGGGHRTEGQSILAQSGSSTSHWKAKPPKGRPPPTFGFGLAPTPFGEPLYS